MVRVSGRQFRRRCLYKSLSCLIDVLLSKEFQTPHRSVADKSESPLELMVCAQHGHDFVECKSPVHYLECSHYWQRKKGSQRQGRKGDRSFERSPSSNLRANIQKLYIEAESQGESAPHDEIHPGLWGMLDAVGACPNEVTSALGVRPNEVTNAFGVWGTIMLLSGEISIFKVNQTTVP